MRNKKVASVGISIPTDILQAIDRRRGDVPRSRFLLRMLEGSLEEVPIEVERDKATQKDGIR
jgi:hypothetical protein